MSKKPGHAISDVNYWVLGYIAGIPAKEQFDVVSSECPIAEAALLAKRVLEIEGAGGPDDHELLAKAVLHLTVALLEAKK